MKRIIFTASLLFSLGFSFAQTGEVKEKKTWYHDNFATEKYYGVNTENAYKYFESKGLKPKTVVVGVLDSGVEVDHPGLIGNMWKNPNEVPGNGIDDDNNGYVDDIYGWNFIGGKNGDIDVDNMEITRVVKKYKPIFEGEDSAQNKANQAKMKEDFDMYMKSKELFEKKSKGNPQLDFMKKLMERIPELTAMLGDKPFTKENVDALKPSTQEQAVGIQIMKQLLEVPELQGKPAKDVGDFLTKELQQGLDQLGSEAKQYDLNFDPRKEIVGDNYDNYSERFYGNNSYEGPDAMHGTHVAGIIAGLPNGDEVQHGVAYKVAKIMTVRTVPDGDERDKDVANSIRYAVDNGAKILNMSFGKPVSPGKNVVWDAFKYAEDKGVLLVKAAGNENQNIHDHVYYPTNFKNVDDAAPFVKNVIIVGASTNNNDKLRAGFSNYNQKMVDVFAPGQEIYSTVPDGKYQYLQGTSMASPVVAGAAAVLLAYLPNLKPEQIIESLVKTSNKVQTGDFNTFSVAGGVIDVAKAAEYAYENFYKGKSPAKNVKTGVKKVKK